MSKYIVHKSAGEYWFAETLSEAIKIQEEYGGIAYEMMKLDVQNTSKYNNTNHESVEGL